MTLDMTQVVVSAVTTAIVSSCSTTTTIVLMRYFPKFLDNVEKSLKHNDRSDKKEQNEHKTEH